MTLRLFTHPMSPYCQKVHIAFYETAIPFEPIIVARRFGKEAQPEDPNRLELNRLWPIGQYPVLRDETRDKTIPESSIVIGYLSEFYPTETPMVPKDRDLAWETRLRDRFFDLYFTIPTGTIYADELIRPVMMPDSPSNTLGVTHAKSQMTTAYGMLDEWMAGKRWVMGDAFTMADCAAGPALFYADQVMPVAGYKNVADYMRRLQERPSVARALQEAAPYFESSASPVQFKKKR